MFHRKEPLFRHPNKPLRMFTDILDEINRIPLQSYGSRQTLEAPYKFDNEPFELACHASILHEGQDNSPVVIFLPWSGGKSAYVQKLLGGKRHSDWEYIGIDIFNTKNDFRKVLATAVGSQYAYALVNRMMHEQVRGVHHMARRVGVVGFSFGANALSAYITQSLDLPDAIVAIEGGSILETTLRTKYKGLDTDPRTLDALKKQPHAVPVQKPITGRAAGLSAAIINPSDPVVMGQEETWRNATSKMFIHGGHFMAPLRNRRSIHSFAFEHFEYLLEK